MLLHNMRNKHDIDAVFRDKKVAWAVDMDGTLIQQDVTVLALQKTALLPHLWPFLLWALVVAVVRGPIVAFRFLEHRVPLCLPRDVTYNADLIQLLERHRHEGGRAVLATASHVHVGKQVVEKGQLTHLFDDVWGSCMKGDAKHVLDMSQAQKAAVLNDFLVTKEKGFVYAGNSKDDLTVWSHPNCRGMILVNCQDDVLKQALQIPKPKIIVPRRRKGFT